jgi:catechol 2,3-dioxygenase-like lactoylglutathione lyase family enzyme
MLNSLDHVIIAVADLEPAIGAYARLLGRRPSWRGEHPALGTVNALFKLDNTYVELLAPAASEGDWLRKRIEGQGEGLMGLAFGTDDAEKCAAFFRERGLQPQDPSPGMGRDTDSGAFREWTNVHLPTTDSRGLLVFAIEHRTPPEHLPPATAMFGEEGAVFGLDHVVVQTKDPEATKAFYGDALGIRLALDREAAQWGSRMLFFRIGGVTVECVGRLDEEPDPNAPDQLWGAAWRVPDIEAARTRMADAGISVSGIRDGRKPGTRVFSVKDQSCGVPTLVIQPVEAG